MRTRFPPKYLSAAISLVSSGAVLASQDTGLVLQAMSLNTVGEPS